MAEPFLSLNGIAKSYPGVVALDGISLAVSGGEVIGLVGENGAGKSTLMKVLGGVIQPSAGTIILDGQELQRLDVASAIEAGISFVHQELNLFENLDVTANILIGREPLCGGLLHLVDRRKSRALVEPLLSLIGADFKPETLVSSMSIAQRQMLEIAKALSQRARLVIMDEPTSSLTLAETDRLMEVIAGLKRDGVAVIFISHRLSELAQCADRVVVLRDGRMVGELQKQEISHASMIKLMIGRELKSLYTPPAQPFGDIVFEIDKVETTAYPGRPVSLSVRRGEILGLAGLIGSGRTEIARTACCIDPLIGGSVRVNGQPLRLETPSDAIDQGIFLVPEDRKRFGLLLDLSIAENIALPSLVDYAAYGLVKVTEIFALAERQRARLDIKASSIATEVGTLSGGNQQKVVLGKWLSRDPRVLICDEPTRGIDVGAKQEIYAMLRRLADSGVAIIMISSDMEEVIGISDRIAVMHEGQISGLLDRDEFSEHNVLLLAVGGTLH
ncbi:sugar ABC transporter ATP-binding protein [Mesorhizobium marinum]|uniref:Sugar ABC transporter ATP-binding protein n=1 Tax=Mesorhizobium marinum TaxID=3228790 RepID=A0ABV3QVC4_9HYPH